MRIRRVALVSLALASTACSLAYNGSRFQGGNGADTGTPRVDTGVPPADGGGGVDMGPIHCVDVLDCPLVMTYCDASMGVCRSGCDDQSDCVGTGHACNPSTHACDAALPCATDSTCPTDSYCAASMLCALCDADADGYYTAAVMTAATMTRCATGAHVQGGDCDDTNAAVHPFARADCSTALVECCPLPIALPTPPGMSIREFGVTPNHVLFRETPTQRLPLGRLGMSIGNDAPLLTDGTKNGFVAVAVRQSGATDLVLLPLTFDGSVVTPLSYLHGFDVGDFAVGPTIEASNQFVAIAAAGGSNMLAYGQASRGTPIGSPTFGSGLDPLLVGPLGAPSVAIADWLSHAAAAAIFVNGLTGDYIANFQPGIGHRSLPATVRGGTWLAGQGAAVMWDASDSSVGLWNGADAANPLVYIDLSAFTAATASPPTAILATGRAELAVVYERSGASLQEHFVAAVPIGDTTTSPMGRIVLIRWTTNQPTGGSDPTVGPTLSGINELQTNGGIHAQAGVAVANLGPTPMMAYQDGDRIVLRPLGLYPPTSLPENPASLALMQIAAGEIVQAIEIGGGLFPNDPSNAGGDVGRLVVAVQVRTASGTEVRVRALEGCF